MHFVVKGSFINGGNYVGLSHNPQKDGNLPIEIAVPIKFENLSCILVSL